MTEDKKSDKFELEIEKEQEAVEQKTSNKSDIDLELEIMDEQMSEEKNTHKDSSEKIIDIEEDFEKDLDIAVGGEKNKTPEIKATRLSQDDKDDFDDIELEAELSEIPPQKQKKSSSKPLFFTIIALIAIGGGGYYAYQQPQIKELVDEFSSSNSSGNNIANVTTPNAIVENTPINTKIEETVELDIDSPAPEIVYNQENQANTALPTDSVDAEIVEEIVETSENTAYNITEDKNVEDISENIELSDGKIPNEIVSENNNNEAAENIDDISEDVAVITENFSSTKVEETKTAGESFAQEEIQEEIVEKNIDNSAMPNDIAIDMPPVEVKVKEEEKYNNTSRAKENNDVVKSHKTKESGEFETKEIPKTPDDYVRKDNYYDAPPSIDGMQIQKTGPRKVNPSVETGSRFVVVEQSPDTDMIEARIVAAKRAMKLARYDAAVDIYESLYKKNKRDERILMGLAVAYQKTGQNDRAVQIYEQLSDINPKNSDAMVNMLGLIRQQYPEVALKKLIKLKNKYPDNAGIYAQLGVVNADLKNYEEAIKNLSIAASMDSKNAMHLFNIAIIFERMRNPKNAIKYYEKALEVDALYGAGRTINRELVYDRLSKLRRQL